MSKQSTFWNLNTAFGIASFFAIALGSFGFYSALGNYGLRSVGAKAPMSDENIQHVGTFSYYTIIGGFIGFGGATFLACVGGTIAANKNYKQRLVQQSHEKQDKTPYIPSNIASPLVECNDVSKKVYSYYFTKNKQIANGKLIVLGDVTSNMAFLAEATDLQESVLVDLFEVLDGDELIGKCFTSYYSCASVALSDYLERQADFIACLNEGFSRDDIEYCAGCVNLRVQDDDAFCHLHKDGWCSSGNCRDRRIIENYPMAPYEDEALIRSWQLRIDKSQVWLSKTDKGVALSDPITNRYFEFNWFGKRELLSDRIEEIPSGELLDYLQYYQQREVWKLERFDCIRIHEFNNELKGVASLTIRGRNCDIFLTLYQNREMDIEYETCYEFNKYGYPKYPRERKAPDALKGKYNLVNLVKYLKLQAKKIQTA